MYSKITRAIKISVEPEFLPQESNPAEDKYLWAYYIRIENQGAETVQLRNRHWRITDSKGQTQEVRGAGVVGEEPVLAPGGVFEYNSFTPLNTPSGIMLGSYEMERLESGERFEVEVPAFSLDSPYQKERAN